MSQTIKLRSYIGLLIVFVLSLSACTWEITPPEKPPIDGQVAYVLDGDIWLHDLASDEARQLTTDGNNRLPSWSMDGSTLFYSHGPSLAESDLYMLDVDNGGSVELYMEQACCGSPFDMDDVQGVVYLELGHPELYLGAASMDRSAIEDFEAFPLVYEGELSPLGNPLASDGVIFPLELRTEDSDAVYRSLFFITNADSPLEPADEAMLCEFTAMDVLETEESLVMAVAYSDMNDTCKESDVFMDIALDAPETILGVIVMMEGVENSELQVLPSLAYPSLSADGSLMAVERYVPTDDGTGMKLWGVEAYDLMMDIQVDVAQDASEPAWRPDGVETPSSE